MAKEKSQTLLPAYLIVGEDALKRRRALELLRNRTMQEGDIAFNHDVFDCERATGAEIVASCNTLPFASPLRLVEASQIEKLKKQDAEAIAAYLSKPCTTTVLALYGEKLAKNTRLYKAVQALGSTAVISCEPMKRYELERAVRGMATGHGFAITQGAAERLVELVGEDTVRIDTELRKIALSHQGIDPVNIHEIEQMVARTAETKPWVFVNAFAARDVALCLKVYPLIEKRSAYSLMAQCATRIRELICTKALRQRGETHMLADVLGQPAWRVKNHDAWAQKFTEEELRRALITSRDCEKAMKSGSDPDETFLLWVLDVLKA